jgi:polysaccharide biosynthesis protein VpsM
MRKKGGGGMKFGKNIFLISGVSVLSGLILMNNSQAIEFEKMAIIAANDSPTAAGSVVGQDVPIGQSSNGQVSLLPEDAQVSKDDNYFSWQGGYFHPYFTLQGEYTDNLYNVDTNKSTNFLTTASPGLWFALPRKKIVPVTITPHNSSPGGLQMQLKDYEGTDRYQAYALGGLDFKYYSSDSNLNTTDGTLEGMFRYNMRSGLSLQILDRYSRSEDRFDVGSLEGENIGKFYSNIVMATADWKITEKLRAKFDYSNFWLDYDEDVDAFKNRVDNGFDLYGYFVYSIKTSFFLEDKYVDVKYDTGIENDNTQNFIYGGIKWDTTEKLSFLAKGGVQNKTFDNSGLVVDRRDDYQGLALDLQTLYKYTEKTQFNVDLYRTNEETDSVLASDKTVMGATLGYKQKYTDKLSGSLDLLYENADYSQLVAQAREDKRYSVRPAVQYLFREWLMGEVSYMFEKRDSSDDLFDYQSNTFWANIKLAL